MLVADRASGQWVETLEMHGHNKKAFFGQLSGHNYHYRWSGNPTLPL